MKIKLLTIILWAVFCQAAFPQSNVPVDNVKQWMQKRFAKGVIPPFSFVYDGKNSDGFIRNWQYQSEKIPSSEPNQEKYVYSYSDKATGLTVKCTVTCFSDFPALDWVLHFSNTSDKNTPLIEKVAVVNHSFITGNNGTFILHHAKGDDAQRDSFEPIDETMQVGNNIYMTPRAGRSSEGAAFPFFNIEMPGGQGMIVGIGWTGKWYADVTQTDTKSVNLKTGMEKMQLALFPGEEIRTPKICLLFWKGEDRMIGHNRFRQLILAHYSRKINGQFAEYPLSMAMRFGEDTPVGYEYEHATEDYCIALVKRFQQYGIVPEIFSLDAGWYEGCGWENEKGAWWQHVGNWIPDKKRFPNGLKPVADAVHKAGAKLMVWFEPERVRPQTIFDRENPEWLLKDGNPDNYLFNLGNKEARIWLTDYLSDFLKKEGIDYYRQDFNMNPYSFWMANDPPDRTGISEIRHIEGLYAFWDSLLVRFPNLLIDNCASGGRRLDLETTSRSAPLWRTDYHFEEPNGAQCHTYGLNFYLPIHGTTISMVNDFEFHSGLGGAGVFQRFPRGHGRNSIEVFRKTIQEYKSLRPYFYGDYYPLTSTKDYTTDNVWLAYQLNRPKEKDGIIVAFRRADNKDASIQIKPFGLEKDAVYELYNEDKGIQFSKTGSELMNGFDITISDKPGSLLIKYRQLQ